MDKKALQLISCCALPRLTSGFCGSNTALAVFRRCVIKGDCTGFTAEIKSFKTLNPYLNFLKKVLGLPKFSYKVAEAYWFGNKELEKVKPGDFTVLLECFKAQGVPQSFIEVLKQNPPKVFIPTHLFQILYVSPLSSPAGLNDINNCMIRWGEVENLKGDTAEVSLNSLRKIPGGYRLCVLKETVTVTPGFVPELKKGDYVIVHWNQLTRIINTAESEQLAYWSQRVLNATNASHK